jgi:hypothetical protein
MADQSDDFPYECGSCRFWMLNALDHGGNMLKGHCRRYPPNVVMDTPEQPSLNDGWPTVHAQSWCGEYLKRPQGVPLAVLEVIWRAERKGDSHGR